MGTAMFNSMATRLPPGGIPGDTTDFVLHKSQQAWLQGIQDRIIDYTEKRLIKYVNSTTDAQQRITILTLIDDYRAGNVAVAWRRGDPTWVKVVREMEPIK